MPNSDNKKSPSALVLPFGKHKGSTVAELLVRDPAYAEWIANQGWVAERFAELHAAILSRGAASDDSPEHNAIQVRFLDETFRVACLLAVSPDGIKRAKRQILERVVEVADERVKFGLRDLPNLEARIQDGPQNWERCDRKFDAAKWLDKQNLELAEKVNEIAVARAWLEKPENFGPFIKTRVRFEDRGIDVLIGWHLDFAGDTWGSVEEKAIEIKPTMGDDFPSVMRQMARLNCRVLVVGEYTGRAVSEPQLRQMFAANNQTLVFVRDIEAEIANARDELAP